jgi:uncharacterized protein (TIGR02391 family)
MADPGSSVTKWKRLAHAFTDRQSRDGNAQRLVTFVVAAMEPVRYTTEPGKFTWRQDCLNEVLSHNGLRVNEKGQMCRGARATTLDEAARIADSVHAELRRRDTHPEVLRYCTTELFNKDRFHAVNEATKGLFQRLRDMTGHAGDGNALINAVIMPGSTGTAKLRINAAVTDSHQSEQKGFGNLLLGLYGMYRNPVAHDPRLLRPVSNADLLECFTALSLAHRRLDNATVTKPSQNAATPR